MLNLIDNFLNKITMYRLVLYVLCFILAFGIIFSIFGILPYNPLLIFSEFLFITLVCFVTNKVFASALKVPANVESVYITALILSLILGPVIEFSDLNFWWFLFLASALAMASKYILVIKKKHIFNPAAFGALAASLLLGSGLSWWVGDLAMLPFVFIGGILVLRKLQRFQMVALFLVVALVSIILSHATNFAEALDLAKTALLYSPLPFFAAIMFTEPMTTPSGKNKHFLYAVFVGAIYSPFLHIGSFYFSPEIALLIGNVFSYLINSKQRLVLYLQEKKEIARDTYEFIFSGNEKLIFEAGQYLEWTIDPKGADTRGNRRYFTLASSPTEKEIRIGVRFYPNGSSFKKNLLAMNKETRLLAGELSGGFVMPKDKNKKLAFLAGGIGITPFRSMLKYLLDTGEKRNISMLYSSRVPEDIAYQEIIIEAEKKVGLKNVYTITDELPASSTWNGKRGMVNKNMIVSEIPDYLEREFYLSGTHGMVVAFYEILKELGVPESKIKKDFFPGYV